MAATSSVRAFVAIAYNEVLLNTRRVAPYVLIIVCSAAALMGWVEYLATILLTCFLLTEVGLIAMLSQVMRGHTPIDFSAYLLVYGVVLVPGVVFITSFVVALNVLLRNKYAAYVIAIGTGAGLFYLYSVGHNHWLYNPLLYQLWKFGDLTTGRILTYRLYWLALAFLCLGLAHVLFERKSK